MNLIRPQDAVHKAQLLRLLIEIADDPDLSQEIIFKGGTCASMLGFLDRFSVDLDFDLVEEKNTEKIRRQLKNIFRSLNLEVKDESPSVLEFTLRYNAPPGERNSLRLDVIGKNYKENVYEPQFLPEIKRFFKCQTVETMFSHKLVAVTERFAKHGSIAGRDIYDIHYFFQSNRKYLPAIIKVRTGKTAENYLKELLSFIKDKITVNFLVSDLGLLLPQERMPFVRKSLLLETLMFLENEIKRLA